MGGRAVPDSVRRCVGTGRCPKQPPATVGGLRFLGTTFQKEIFDITAVCLAAKSASINGDHKFDFHFASCFASINVCADFAGE
jgi:hypothetical protein